MPADNSVNKRARPEIFISHASEDKELATALRQMLTGASAGHIKVFNSSELSDENGIAFGENWYERIMKRLERTTMVIAVLTASSNQRPWVFFESGIARGRDGVRLTALLVGPEAEQIELGPFQPFQCAKLNREELIDVVRGLINDSGGAPDHADVPKHVERFIKIVNAHVYRRNPSKPVVRSETLTSLYGIDDERLRAIETILFDDRTRELEIPFKWLSASSVCFSAIPWLEAPSIELYRILLEENARIVSSEEVENVVGKMRSAMKVIEFCGPTATKAQEAVRMLSGYLDQLEHMRRK